MLEQRRTWFWRFLFFSKSLPEQAASTQCHLWRLVLSLNRCGPLRLVSLWPFHQSEGSVLECWPLIGWRGEDHLWKSLVRGSVSEKTSQRSIKIGWCHCLQKIYQNYARMGNSWIALKVFTTHDGRIGLVAKTVYDWSQRVGVQVILTANIIHRTWDWSHQFPLKHSPENFLKVKKGIRGIIWKRGSGRCLLTKTLFWSKDLFQGVLHWVRNRPSC